MPTASVGAPPVRATRVGSSTAAAAAAELVGVIVKPRLATAVGGGLDGGAEHARPGRSSRSTGRGRCIDAAISAMIATNDSIEHAAVADEPDLRLLLIIFGVVPEAISAWKPDSAPQAMVMNTNGNSAPAKTGPVAVEANSVTASFCSTGAAISTPTASSAMVPIFMNVDR